MRAETIVLLVVTLLLTVPFLVRLPADAFQAAPNLPTVHTPR